MFEASEEGTIEIRTEVSQLWGGGETHKCLDFIIVSTVGSHDGF